MKWKTEAQLPSVSVKDAYDLFWIAFLLTGDRSLSVEAVIEAMQTSDAADRRVFVAKVLGVVQPELSASIRRAEVREFQRLGAMEALTDGTLAPVSDMDKCDLGSALLAIEIFPRCALLLTVFERLSLDEAASLLQVDRKLMTAARTFGLIELARNIHGRQAHFDERVSAA